jgi:colanic acid/amylovoran biosynthesis glycosyltransferase
MKIAFIVPEFPSISQTFVLNQITGLLDKGHDIEIFAVNKPASKKCHEDVIKYGLLDRTSYLAAVPASRVKRLSTGILYVGRYFRAYPRAILNSLNVLKFGKPAISFTLLCTIAPFLGKGPYDIIHCHFGPCGNIGIQCIRTRALTGKIVTTFHGYDLSSYLVKNNRCVYHTLFEYGDLCLPISLYWKKKLIELGCPPEKLKVHHMGVDTRQFDSTDAPKGPNEKIRILTVARLVEKKGVKYGIQAVADASKAYPNIEYLIAGDGPLKSEIEKQIKDLRLNECVRLLGWVKQSEVTELMTISDILIAPSITGADGDQEGIPVVLMEALAKGVNVISTDHSGIPELVVHGETGLIAPERDSDKLADHIITLIENQNLKERLQKNGRNHVKSNYNIFTLNQNLETIYHGLLNT